MQAMLLKTPAMLQFLLSPHLLLPNPAITPNGPSPTSSARQEERSRQELFHTLQKPL